MVLNNVLVGVAIVVATLLVFSSLPGIHQTIGAPTTVVYFSSKDSEPAEMKEMKDDYLARVNDVKIPDSTSKASPPTPPVYAQTPEQEADRKRYLERRSDMKKAGLMVLGGAFFAASFNRILGLFVNESRAAELVTSKVVSHTHDYYARLVPAAGGGTVLQVPTNATDPQASTLSAGALWANASDGTLRWMDTISGFVRSAKTWKGYVTVSSQLAANSNGLLNGGADAGADTVGTITNGWLEGATLASATGQMLKIDGTYTQQNPVTLGSTFAGLVVEFVNTTVTIGSGLATKQLFVVAANNVTFRGSLTYNGNNVGAQGFSCTGGFVNMVFDFTSTVITGIPASPVKYFIITNNNTGLNASTGLTIRGRLVTDGSVVVRAVDVSNVDISGISSQAGGFSQTYGDDVVRVVATGLFTIRRINVHDIVLDGNGLAPSTGLALITIATNGATIGTLYTPSIFGVTVSNLQLRNTMLVPRVTASGDGMDLAGIDGFSVTNVVGDLINNLVSCVCVHGTISDVVGVNCNAPAILIGDPGVQRFNVFDVTVTGCEAIASGQGFSTAFGAGFGVTQNHNGGGGGLTSTSFVSFVNCNTRNLTGSDQKWGICVSPGISGDGAQLTNISIIGGSYAGWTGALFNTNNASNIVQGGIVRIADAIGISPFGKLATPFAGTSVGWIAGTTGAAAPTAAVVYAVVTTKVYVTSSGGSITITVNDNLGNLKFSGATCSLLPMEIGDTISFSSAVGITVTVFGA